MLRHERQAEGAMSPRSRLVHDHAFERGCFHHTRDLFGFYMGGDPAAFYSYCGAKRELHSQQEAELVAAATGLCMWIRHILPEWDSEVQTYLDLTEQALRKANGQGTIGAQSNPEPADDRS